MSKNHALVVYQCAPASSIVRPILLRVNLLLLFFFSYMTLLTIAYGSTMEKTQKAHCMAEQEGLSFREAEQVVETELFLDEYHRWNIGSPHRLVI